VGIPQPSDARKLPVRAWQSSQIIAWADHPIGNPGLASGRPRVVEGYPNRKRCSERPPGMLNRAHKKAPDDAGA
jgi:hypothetical protein